MYYPSDRNSLASRIQAPWVRAEIRALRGSICKGSPQVQRALAIAASIEQAYDLGRADLFLPAIDTFCAILEPLAMTVLSGTLRRVGYEIFPQYVSGLGVAANTVAASAADLIRVICDAWSQCVV